MKQISSLIDVFYPPFRKIMPLQTFRYAACGGANTILGLTLYAISLRYIFDKQVFYLGISAFKAHNAALFFSSCIVFCVGFLLNKYVVFITSELRGRIQLFRYFISFFFNLCVNYFLLKILVEFLYWDPFLSQIITTVIIIALSYMTQKHFSFKTSR